MSFTMPPTIFLTPWIDREKPARSDGAQSLHRLGYRVSHPTSRKPFKSGALIAIRRGASSPGSSTSTAAWCGSPTAAISATLASTELTRRRVRVIVACDGTADPTFGFSDFVTLLQRIETDFGAHIVFDETKHGLDVLVPTTSADLPRNTQLAKRGFTVGQVTYSDGTTGSLLYVMTTLFKSSDSRPSAIALRIRTSRIRPRQTSFSTKRSSDPTGSSATASGKTY